MTGGTDLGTLAIELYSALGDETRRRLSLQLRRGCHDLNNPLGTIGLELFSLDEVLESLVETLGSSVNEAAGPDLAEIRTIVKNLAQAQRQLEETVTALQQFARALA